MERLGGSIVRDAREGERESYRLTFLGVLLTADGPAIELLLVRYLEWLKARRRTQANLTSASRDDVPADLSITPAAAALHRTCADRRTRRRAAEGRRPTCEASQTWPARLRCTGRRARRA